jgi:LuxR family transcriptional regulator, maltose regulon positive regulatory protein
MQRLLEHAVRRSLASDYVDNLLAAFTGAIQPFQAGQPSDALAEPLSERELEVLRLMVGRLSNKEIAKELSLSLHTVKWYARGIFEKLGVHKRSSAVAKAKGLGIL